MQDERSSAMPDQFDRLMGQLDGLPDVTNTKPSTIRTMTPLLGTSQLFIVQTYRQRDIGDTVFLECVDKDGTTRIALPPQVADAISRQRDSLTGKVRSKIAKAVAADRKARGLAPGFMKNRGRGRSKSKG